LTKLAGPWSIVAGRCPVKCENEAGANNAEKK
jgi:hypothetical protein